VIAKVNLAEKFGLVHEHWSPRLVATVNDTAVKLVKLRGEFVWHRHDLEDELFLVVRGSLRIELRDGVIALEPGEMVVIPRGVEHRPVADDEVEVLLVEPTSTLNTGNVRNERTRERVPEV
jgi:mannose-6-phosphate isomerase-like protein (cupin superfamily)